MCGLAGFLDRDRAIPPERMDSIAAGMAETLRHRGPDAGATWCDPAAGIAFGHRRLAIRDLSPTGAQPMIGGGGRYVLAYNGEIYDAEALRDELATRGTRFRGPCDTEVLLEALIAFGVEGALPRLNGMFAFALWDAAERVLWLARDRLGIKPLYWAEAGRLFLFGSELKALAAHPAWRPDVDRGALAAFARLSYVPSPVCIWKGARKLEPGTVLRVATEGPPRVIRYWDMAAVAARPRDAGDERAAADRLEELLARSVRRRLVSDVPLGAFLSGGTDSALVTALMQKASPRPVKTYTIAFAEASHDESKAAAEIGRRLGTEHSVLEVTPADMLACVPDLARCYDEPFADSSQVPSLLISRFAREGVVVALSGDGGDEAFAGYNRHRWAARTWPLQRRLPAGLRRAAAAAVDLVPPALWNRLGPALGLRQGAEKAEKLAAVLREDGLDDAYRVLAGQGADGGGLVLDGREPVPPEAPAALTDPVERLQFLDTVGYLPDDILTKLDRASMAVGLEARVPLLDHTVIEFAWRLPPGLRVGSLGNKHILRRVLYRHLPERLFAGRPKSGFAVPLAAWLRGPLREWAGDLLAPTTLAAQGFFDPARVAAWWDDHRAGRRLRHHALWNVVMFQAWHAAWHAGRGPRP